LQKAIGDYNENVNGGDYERLLLVKVNNDQNVHILL